MSDEQTMSDQSTVTVRALPPNLELLVGSHADAQQGMCVMEAVAFVAGEPFSDEPACACPVLGAFLRSWNDGIQDTAHRTALLTPLVERLVGSRSTKPVEQMRADLAMDWLARVQAPAWLDLTPALRPRAAELRGLAPLNSAARAKSAHAALQKAGNDAAAARAAAWDAAWDAARDAARDAAWDAARDAAWDAAWAAAAWAAARDAARAAAWAAAWDAAWAAAWAAARAAIDSSAAAENAAAALRPTVAALEVSALQLVDRMLAVTPETTPEQLDALCQWDALLEAGK